MDRSLAQLINGAWRKGRNPEQITVVDPAWNDGRPGNTVKQSS